MTLRAAPPVAELDLALDLGDRIADLSTRALIVARVPEPRWARAAEVIGWSRAVRTAGADVVEVPADPRLIGPAAQESGGAVTARATSAEAVNAVHAAGAAFALVPVEVAEQLAATDDQPGPVVVLASDLHGARDAIERDPSRPVAVDVTRLSKIDAVSEESLALSVGVRLVVTGDVPRTRRVVEVMARLLEARR